MANFVEVNLYSESSPNHEPEPYLLNIDQIVFIDSVMRIDRALIEMPFSRRFFTDAEGHKKILKATKRN